MFKIFVLIAATFVNGSDKPVVREIINGLDTYSSQIECRDALQHSAHVQGAIASAVNKANKKFDDYQQPDGYHLRGKRVNSRCFPADTTLEEAREALSN